MRGCHYGKNCKFSHSNPNSLKLCRFYDNNCRFGKNCKFRHINHLRNSHQNKTNAYQNVDSVHNKQIKIIQYKAYTPSSPWIQLAPIPISNFYDFHLIRINDDEFVIIGATSRDLPRDENDAIYKYNIRQNKWIYLMEYMDPWLCSSLSVSYNKSKQLIYILHRPDDYIMSRDSYILDVKQNTMKAIQLRIPKASSTICIDHKIHLISPGYFDHDVTDTEIKTDVLDFTSLNNNLEHVFEEDYSEQEDSLYLIELKTRGSIISFGGLGWLGNVYHSIFEYNIKQNKWYRLNVEVPKDIEFSYDIVVTKDERYIICLGGVSVDPVLWRAHHDSIYVLDTNTIDDERVDTQWVKCNMKLPKGGKCKALMMNNKYDDETLVFGFFRYYYSDFPVELVKLMLNWVSIEYIHVFMPNHKGREKHYDHWRISVDHIIGSIGNK